MWATSKETWRKCTIMCYIFKYVYYFNRDGNPWFLKTRQADIFKTRRHLRRALPLDDELFRRVKQVAMNDPLINNL